MSVHSHPAAHYEAATPEFPRHVVTAVLVCHDGARWLPDTLAGLVGQVRPVQNVIAADTGSADDSARLVSETLGPDRVLHLARRTGFGTAVAECARTAEVLTPDDLPYLKRPSGWDPVTRTWHDEAYDMPELPHGEPVQWLWLLHDDCAPEPDALGELLRVADANPSAAIVGPKLRGWYDRRQLLEVGVSIAHSGRRWTGLERREQDQGQHDGVRPVLSVSTAGMLIRRDVFEELGGFDPRLPLMRDDVDLCWRAHRAGHQVFVAPDAVARHAEAASRERRTIDCVGRTTANPHRVDKAGAVYTLLANTRGAVLPWVFLRLVLGTLLRALAYLVGKVPGHALNEITALTGTLLRPGRLLGARRRRGKPVVEAKALRPLFPPPGATVRVTVEQVVSNLSGRLDPELSSGGRHGAVETGPGDEEADFLEVEQFARLKRIGRKPGPMLFLVLLVVSLVACRALLDGGALAGGALLPAPAEVSDLWARYLDGWHPVGTGTTEAAPPYLAFVALLATLLGGSTGGALTLLLVCSVPLAGFSAYFASRPLVDSRLLRAWGSVVYAFLPAATGALAGGHIGTAVLAVLLPLLARAAVAVAGLRHADARPSWRAAWASALLLTVTTAFTPLVWPLALLLCLALLALRLRRRRPLLTTVAHVAVLLVTPLVLLAPWSLTLLTTPSRFLRQVGLDHGAGAADALDLLLLSPGGPKGDGGLLMVGVLLGALAALLRRERRTAVLTAWTVALVGLLGAAIGNGSGWAGPACLVYGLGLLTAAVVGAEDVRDRVAARSFGWRQPVAALIAFAAAAGPLLAAAGWMLEGAAGPLTRRDPVQVPAFVAEESSTRDQARTLVLDGTGRGTDIGVHYMLVRGSGARLGDGDLALAAGDDGRLAETVAHLVAGSGADQTSRLGSYAVRYVLVRDGAPRQLSRVLDGTPGLTRLSQEDGSALWRVEADPVARVTIVPGDRGKGDGAADEPVPVAAGPVEAHTDIPKGPAGRVLRVADAAADGWRATLDGEPLPRTTVDGWAQGFELPARGGRLDLTYETPVLRTGWVTLQGFLLLVTIVLALPGRRREMDDDLPDAEPVPAQPVPGEGRRARRLRAAAEAAGTVAPASPTGPPTADGSPGTVPPQAPPVGSGPFDGVSPDAVPDAPPPPPAPPPSPPAGAPAEPPPTAPPGYGDAEPVAAPYGDGYPADHGDPWGGAQPSGPGAADVGAPGWPGGTAGGQDDPYAHPAGYGDPGPGAGDQGRFAYDPSAYGQSAYDPSAFDPSGYDPSGYGRFGYDDPAGHGGPGGAAPGDFRYGDSAYDNAYDSGYDRGSDQ